MREGIALVNEDRKGKGLLLDMSIAQNISISNLPAMSRRFSFVDNRAERDTGRQMVGKRGVKCTGADQLGRYLSGGNQQKVVLAKWLLADEGMGIWLLSSEMPEVISLAHRIIVLRNGAVNGSLPGKGATQNEILMIAAGE